MQASLSPERWDQIQRLFNEVVDLQGEARTSYLDEACRDDFPLRAEVESLLEAYEEADDLLQGLEQVAPPLSSEPQPQADSSTSREGLRISHYDVLEKLGGGGMGVVYKARDIKLDRIVALKFLPPHLSANADVRRRFIQEAKAASALDHNNICAIHEIGEATDGQLFIAMAYYGGETLKQKIRQGPVPLNEALDYAVQMAKGLERAHEATIIHRDIKPANVIVTNRGVIKILDFGLAKIADVKLTRSGATMGTVAYMSPEQARGEQVDQRTDLWSLGVVLYEMLTGRLPFDGEYDQALIYALLHEQPQPVSEVNPAVPEDLSHVVGLCLEKDRTLRYPTMSDLLADLEVFVQGSRTNSTTALHAVQQRRRKTRQKMMMGAGVVGGLLLLMALLLAIPASRAFLLSPFEGAAAEEKQIVVLPFTNNLGDTPENQALVDGLTQTVTGMVARLESLDRPLWVVPATDVIRQEVRTAQDARVTFNVNTVLEGSVQRLGDATVLALSLVDPSLDVPRIDNSVTVMAPLNPALLDEVFDALTGLLEVPMDAEVQQVQQAVKGSGPTAPDAYAFYLRGVGYLQRFDIEGNLNNAITVFAQALDEDSLYAPAYAGLCEALWEQYRRTTEVEQAEQALQNCDRAEALASNEATVLIPLGTVYLETGEFEKAETALRRALELEPNNADAYRWLGQVYSRQAQFDEAEEALKQAIVLKPDLWISYNDLGILYSQTGRFEEAIEQFDVVRRLTPDNFLAYNALGVVRRNMNQIEEAKRMFQRAIALRPDDPLTRRNLGRLYLRDQQYDLAVQELETALDLHEKAPFVAGWMIWSWLGHAYYWAGDTANARIAWENLIALAEAKLEINANDNNVLLLLTDAYAALGNQEQGFTYLNRLLDLPLDDIQQKYYIGRIYEMLGDRQQALDYIGQALEGRFDPVTPDQDPWLNDLRTEPRYQALRQQFQDPA